MNDVIHVLCVIGTRPEAIKMAPVIAALRREPWARCTVAVTAQHRELLDTALGVFGFKADIDLDLMRPDQTLGSLTGHAFLALEPVLRELKPDLVLAQGDTTTVMVTAPLVPAGRKTLSTLLRTSAVPPEVELPPVKTLPR